MEHILRQSIRGLLMLALSWCFLGARGYIYDNPLNWPNEDFFCGGCLQSPINLVTATADRIKLSPLILTNYEKENDIKLTNNGDSIIVDVNIFLNATVTGGNNNDVFQADLIHFHWIAEHEINFKTFELEMQIVHRNQGYSDRDNAVTGLNGFLNFAIFFRGVNKDRKVPAGIKAICDSLDRVRFAGRSTTLSGISLASLVTNLNMDEYFTYCGSDTVPPCTPNVIWIVFANPLDISSACLLKLRTLLSSNGKNMTDTRRPPQNLDGRRIFYNVRSERKL